MRRHFRWWPAPNWSIRSRSQELREVDGQPEARAALPFSVVKMELSDDPGPDGGRRRLGADDRSLRSQILDLVGHAVAVVDLQGKIIFWNKFSEAFYGWTEAEALGRNLRELVMPEESSPDGFAELADVRAGQSTVSEVKVRRRDGTSFCSLMANTPLRDAHGQVIGRIAAATDISKRKEDEERLRESERQLRALTRRLTTVREEEATRIAREIHDQMGQALTALKMDVAALELALGGQKTDDRDGTLAARIASMSSAVDLALETASKLCTELRPAVLDKLGLLSAIEWAGRDFEGRSGIFCNLILPAEPVAIDPARATAVFRIFQEILTNVIRHAEASEVTVQLTLRPGFLRLAVSDNGRGLGPDKHVTESGLGIIGMRERALAVGGTIELREATEHGTIVIVQVPNE